MVAKLIAVAGALLVLQFVHLVTVMRWSDQQTCGLSYYGRSRRGRRRFRRLLRIHGLLVSPILRLIAGVTRPRFSRRCFVYRGTAGPAGACSADSFQRAAGYSPRPEDVFVVTQMRSGTTLTQHLVFQVLSRGAGDLAEDDVALNAVAPWLESNRTVGVDDAPLIGEERPSRLIKTHLPAALCPFSPRAKYIYVVRHPASCFASCVDFVRSNLWCFAPDMEEMERWYRSNDLMWWNTWVTHVAGWWRRAEREPNVLLIRFEDMIGNLEAVGRRLAEFLGVRPLTESELAAVAHKCSFAYMRANADIFEMYPPHLLQAANPFFTSGRTDRYGDVPADVRQRIADWCREQCAAQSIAVHRLYADLGGDQEATPPALCGPEPREEHPASEALNQASL